MKVFLQKLNFLTKIKRTNYKINSGMLLVLLALAAPAYAISIKIKLGGETITLSGSAIANANNIKNAYAALKNVGLSASQVLRMFQQAGWGNASKIVNNLPSISTMYDKLKDIGVSETEVIDVFKKLGWDSAGDIALNAQHIKDAYDLMKEANDFGVLENGLTPATIAQGFATIGWESASTSVENMIIAHNNLEYIVKKSGGMEDFITRLVIITLLVNSGYGDYWAGIQEQYPEQSGGDFPDQDQYCDAIYQDMSRKMSTKIDEISAQDGVEHNTNIDSSCSQAIIIAIANTYNVKSMATFEYGLTSTYSAAQGAQCTAYYNMKCAYDNDYHYNTDSEGIIEKKTDELFESLGDYSEEAVNNVMNGYNADGSINSQTDTSAPSYKNLNFQFGQAEHEDEYLVGDWDGDGLNEIAVRRGNQFYLSFDNDTSHDKVFTFGNGNSEDQHLVGDWDGDGVDEIAVRRGNTIYFNYGHNSATDHQMNFGNGNSESNYYAGDWDNDGVDEIAVRRNDVIYLTYDHNSSAEHQYTYGTGDNEDGYIVGDWDGDGDDEFAFRRFNTVIKNYQHDSEFNSVVSFGLGNEGQYISGDWDGDGVDDLGLVYGNYISFQVKSNSGLNQNNIAMTTHTPLGQGEIRFVSGSINNQLDHNWRSYNFGSTYLNEPAVFTSAPSFNGGDGGVNRIANVQANSFDIAFTEWNYLDGSHTTESFSYLALEEGRYTMADGTIIEVGSFTLDGVKTFDSVTFNQNFSATPSVFLQVQTFDGTDTVSIRAKSISTTGFQAALYEQDSLNSGDHTTEKVSYLAIQPGNGTRGSIETNVGAYAYSLSSANIDHNGGQIGSHYYKIVEESSLDDEIEHTTETIQVIDINGVSLAQQVSNNGGDTVSIRKQ